MEIREAPNTLVLRDQPGCIWLLSAFFISIGGLFVLGPLFFMTNRFEQPWYVIALAVFLGLSGVAVGVWQAYRTPYSVITFRREDRSISRITWGLNGRHEQCWGFAEVSGIEVVEEKDSEGDPVYRLRLNLGAGGSVWLSGVFLHARETCDRAAERANFIIGQEPNKY